MPVVEIACSPLAPGNTPVRIHYRDWRHAGAEAPAYGAGPALIFLHGGWGYRIYPFDAQREALASRFRVLVPDRSGYGRSTRITTLPPGFHRDAAVEMFGFLDALRIERAVLWGHSDGAVIAAKMALLQPDRVSGLILEALHYYRVKPGSREFFETMMADPDRLGDRVVSTLSADHGEEGWRQVIRLNGQAWLAIAREASRQDADLYDGQLSQLVVPTLILHGGRDPRTEPGELAAVGRALPRARFAIIEEAGHSPHSERAFQDEANRRVDGFLEAAAITQRKKVLGSGFSGSGFRGSAF